MAWQHPSPGDGPLAVPGTINRSLPTVNCPLQIDAGDKALSALRARKSEQRLSNGHATLHAPSGRRTGHGSTFEDVLPEDEGHSIAAVQRWTIADMKMKMWPGCVSGHAQEPEHESHTLASILSGR